MRWRVTIRGDAPTRVELRGYIDESVDVGALAAAMEPFGLVMVSPESDAYDPFASWVGGNPS
jgi:hypothetical protein